MPRMASLRKRLTDLIPELARFGVVGLIGSVIDLGGADYLHVHMGIGPLVAKAASIAAATVVGLALGYTPIDPIRMLIWSAVLNGIVAVPIMAVMMTVVTRLSVMGRFSARRTLTFFGWAGTALMAVTVVALFWSWID